MANCGIPLKSDPHCYLYIELNPVRARLCKRPKGYRWTSHHCHAYGHLDPVVTLHSYYQSLGKDDTARQRNYRRLFRQQLSEDELRAIRSGV